MNEKLTVLEIIEIAIEIEKNGETFYNMLAESAETAILKDLFKYLSAEEKKHKLKFQEILKSIGDYQVSEIYYATEYMGYMKALADNRVFRQDISPSDLAKNIKNPMDAIDVAIGFEKDSIIFLYETRDMFEDFEKEAIQMLLKEEKGHIRKLSELKKSIK